MESTKGEFFYNDVPLLQEITLILKEDFKFGRIAFKAYFPNYKTVGEGDTKEDAIRNFFVLFGAAITNQPELIDDIIKTFI